MPIFSVAHLAHIYKTGNFQLNDSRHTFHFQFVTIYSEDLPRSTFYTSNIIRCIRNCGTLQHIRSSAFGCRFAVLFLPFVCVCVFLCQKLKQHKPNRKRKYNANNEFSNLCMYLCYFVLGVRLCVLFFLLSTTTYIGSSNICSIVNKYANKFRTEIFA